MEAIGRLAGGIAHDFNNMLTAVLGYSSIVAERLDPDDPLQQEIAEIAKAGERATSLTRQLLAFSRSQVLQPSVVDLNGIVTGMRDMLTRLIGEDVELHIALDRTLGAVRADPGQLEQVIMNLAVNARHAMPEGGKLTIETYNVELAEEYLDMHFEVQPGAHVLLAVSDTGHGMDEQIRARIFEPFFTTKGRGEGTGLGLSTVYGIIEQSGGHVSVYSEPGHGTTFKVYLPRVDDRPAIAPRARAARPAHGSETVLLVEDEEPVRRLASRVLAQAGYIVLEALNGDEALEIAERHEGPIELLLTDVVMPGFSGADLAERIGLLRPRARVLFMSGYTDEAIVRHGVLTASSQLLGKPFTPDVLTARVREVLDAPSAAEARSTGIADIDSSHE